LNKPVVWTAAAVAAVGFGVPAYAAITSPGHIRQIAPTPVVSVAPPDWTTTIDDSSTTVSVTSPPATIPTISLTVNSSTSVGDVSGNCDEAEHADDAACASVNASGATDTSTPNSVDDNSGSDNSGRGSNSGHGGDDSGGDDSGHGGSDD
jgi:hypothetical protein